MSGFFLSFFLPLKPRYFSRPAATSCTHHGFRQTWVLETLADSPVVKQTQTTCKPDFRSCIHLQFFWERKSPGFTHESTWQTSHCYGAISQTTVLWSLVFCVFFFFFPLTLLHSLQIFPAIRAPLSTFFQSKLYNSNSSLKKKNPGKTHNESLFETNS